MNRKTKSANTKLNTQQLFTAVRQLIDDSKISIAVAVNQRLTILYWNIGKMIKGEILNNKRAGYGEQVIQNLSKKLTSEYGSGWSKQQVWNCLYTVEIFPKEKIISTLSGELSWSHLKKLIYIRDNLQREFYIQLCRNEHWSVRQLRDRINSMLYERTALSKNPDSLIRKELTALSNNEPVSPELFFRDPYFLDFLGLHDTFSEKDLETSIIADLQRFIIELGNDFAFLARQKRIQVDGEDYYIDLLFYNRQLQRLVAIEKENENTPIGLILCADKADEHIELLELDKGNIRVAQYYTSLPSKKLLQQKLHHALIMAKEKLAIKTSSQKDAD